MVYCWQSQVNIKDVKMDFKYYKSVAPLLLSTVFLFGSDLATACTRVLNTAKDNAVMVGRTMDWFEDLKTNLIIYPRGQSHQGAAKEVNGISWVSNYGSVVATAYERLSSDGMNEAGLAAHILWQKEADYGTVDPKKPTLSVVYWMQYYLDNFKSVEEAIQFAQKNPFQLAPIYHPVAKKWMQVHLVLDDASGDSAIIEYIKGQPRIYHNKEYTAVSNDPAYDQQLLNLKNYSVNDGAQTLPGSTKSQDRFVRASYYSKTLPEVTSAKQQLSEVFSVLNNVAQPYSIITEDNPSQNRTIWSVVADLTNKMYYYQSTDNRLLLTVDLNKFNLAKNAPIMLLDLVNHPEYAGDVTAQFVALNSSTPQTA